LFSVPVDGIDVSVDTIFFGPQNLMLRPVWQGLGYDEKVGENYRLHLIERFWKLFKKKVIYNIHISQHLRNSNRLA